MSSYTLHINPQLFVEGLYFNFIKAFHPADWRGVFYGFNKIIFLIAWV